MLHRCSPFLCICSTTCTPVHRFAGCKLDAWLAQRGGRQATFSRRLAMERYHFKARRFGTLMYRLRLLFGSQVRFTAALFHGSQLRLPS